MALTRFVQAGNTVDYTPSADVAAGAVVVQGELVGVSRFAIADGVLGALVVSGVVDFPKASGSGTAITAGANVYWDVADQQASTDADGGTNKLIGKSVTAAADDDTLVRVRMNQ